MNKVLYSIMRKIVINEIWVLESFDAVKLAKYTRCLFHATLPLDEANINTISRTHGRRPQEASDSILIQSYVDFRVLILHLLPSYFPHRCSFRVLSPLSTFCMDGSGGIGMSGSGVSGWRVPALKGQCSVQG
jgi:hypothetical protein